MFTRTDLPGERQVYRTSGSLVAWWAWVAFAVVLLIVLALGHRDHASLVTAAVVIAITGIMYACALRPRIVADAAGITVVNPLRVHEVPWPAVTQVDLIHNVRVHYRSPAGDKQAGGLPGEDKPGGDRPGGDAGRPGTGRPGGCRAGRRSCTAGRCSPPGARGPGASCGPAAPPAGGRPRSPGTPGSPTRPRRPWPDRRPSSSPGNWTNGPGCSALPPLPRDPLPPPPGPAGPAGTRRCRGFRRRPGALELGPHRGHGGSAADPAGPHAGLRPASDLAPPDRTGWASRTGRAGPGGPDWAGGPGFPAPGRIPLTSSAV